MSEDFLPIGQAAEYLGVSIDTLRRWEEKGKITSQRLDGKNRFFSKEELERVKFGDTLTVKDAAERLGMSPTTLRRISNEGVIPSFVAENGYRQFRVTDLESFVAKESKDAREAIATDIVHKGSEEQVQRPSIRAEFFSFSKSLTQAKTLWQSVILGLVGLAAFSLAVFFVLIYLFLKDPQGTASFFNIPYRAQEKQSILGVSTRKDSPQFISGVTSAVLQSPAETAVRVIRVFNPSAVNDIILPEQLASMISRGADVSGLPQEGLAGRDGEAGAPGKDGYQGVVGPTGVSGAMGVPGTNGSNGSAGPTGVPGSTGATGPAGTFSGSYSSADGLVIQAYGTGVGETTALLMYELESNGSEYVGLKAPDAVSTSQVWTLPASDGTSGQCISTDGAGTLSFAGCAASSGITSLNGLTTTSQLFATGTSGTDFNISSSGTTHTFNIPDANATNRGLVTTGAQTFAGIKTFSSNLNADGGFDVDDAFVIADGGVLTTSQLATFNGTLDANGTVTIGDDADTVAIDSSVWNITAAGAASGLTGITSSGTVTFSGLTTDGIVTVTNGILGSTAGGSGSTIDADLLDSLSSSAFLRSNANTTFSGTNNVLRFNDYTHLVFGSSGTPFDMNFNGTSTFLTQNSGDIYLESLGGGLISNKTNSFEIKDTSSNPLLTMTSSGTLNVNNGLFQVNALGAVSAAAGITSSGTVTLSSLNTAGALLYTNGSGVVANTAQGSSGQCLISNGSSSPSWTSCDSVVNYWNQASGLTYLGNTTSDFAIGGTATSSAKFAVTNVNSGTPTASVSAGLNGGIYLTADGKLATTTKQNLTLGDSTTTGNVIINPSGKVGIGTTSPSEKLEIASGNVLLSNNNAIKWKDTGGTSRDILQVDNNNNVILGNTTVGSANTNIRIAGITGSTTFTTHNGSSELMRIESDGDVGIGTTGADAKLDVLATGGEQLRLTYADGSVYTGLTVDSGGDLTVDATGNDLISADRMTLGTTTAGLSQFTVSGKQTGKALVTLNETGDQAIFTASASGTTRFTLANSGNITAGGTISGLTGLTSSGTITLSSLNTDGALLYTNSSGVVANTAQGGSGECLVSGGSSAPTWVNCAGASNNYFSQASGFTYLGNTTSDFAVGGTATSSAKFAVTNVNSGTPTASVSAGLTGGAYLTAAGKLATTNSQTLTIGDTTTTGNIVLNSAGNVGVGTSSPNAKLDVSGAASISGSLTYQNAASSIQTTAKNTLTLGGSTTGDIQFLPGNSSTLYLSSSGNVGIGDSSPTGLLTVGNGDLFQVNSAGSIISSRSITTNGYILLTQIDPDENILEVRDDSGGTPLMVDSAGLVGIGDTTPASLFTVGDGDLFQVNSSGAITAVVGITSTGNINANAGLDVDDAFTVADGGLTVTVLDNFWQGLGASAGRIEFDDQTIDEVNILGANVGIGTTTPERLLHILGSTSTTKGLKIEGDDSGIYLEDTGTNPSEFKIFNNEGVGVYQEAGSGTGTKFFIAQSDGEVTIGSDQTPDASLEVINNGSGDSFLVADTNDGDTTPFVIDADGDVGIGQSAPALKLHIGSSAVTDSTNLLRLQDANSTCDFNANTGSPTCGSDETLKKDISALNTSDLLDKVSGLKPVSYRWKTDDANAPMQFGFIAQEVQQLFPDLVSDGKWVDGSTKKFLNIGGLMPYVVGAMKEQQLQIDKLSEGLKLSAIGDGEGTKALSAAIPTPTASPSSTGDVSKQEILGAATRITDKDELLTYADLTPAEIASYKLWKMAGDIVFTGQISFIDVTRFLGDVVFTRDTVGTVTIPTNTTKVAITFTKPFSKTPIVNLTSVQSIQGEYMLEEVTTKGFVLSLTEGQIKEVKFNWIAFVAEGEKPQVKVLETPFPSKVGATPTPTTEEKKEQPITPTVGVTPTSSESAAVTP